MDPTRIKIASLWIVVMFNIAFADIIGFIHPGTLQKIMAWDSGFSMIGPMLLLVSVLTEVPIVMVFLSLVLPEHQNRTANSFAAVLTVLYVIGGGSFTLSYAFFVCIELACMGLILRYAWHKKTALA